ncbi:aquaporin FA-CHIP-like isoform X2 [Symsagittifera roscoffensis]|uniref:aquaporin FA-CHIP-like isoform X2 n=1 Tax=Symsagittifera roscoffensis TaxID=84072 RepID=UPI00307B380B
MLDRSLNPEQARPDQMISTSLAICSALIIAIYLCGPTSGSHINPAMTVCKLLTGSTNLVKVLLYSVAQFIGALCATGTLCALCPSDWILGQGHLDGTGHPNWLLELNPKSTFTQGLFVEILATMLLGLVFLLVTDPIAGKQFAGVAPIIVGLVVSGLFLSISPLTKCCMNPAIALAQAMIMSHYDISLLVYTLGPFLGAVAAALVYSTLLVHGIRQKDEYEDLRLVLNYRKADSKYDG